MKFREFCLSASFSIIATTAVAQDPAPSKVSSVKDVVVPVAGRTVKGDDTQSPFPRPAALHSAVAFWTDVFSKYSEYQSVVHDMDDLSRVYYVLDYSQQALTMDRYALAKLRADDERKTRDRIEAMLKHIDAVHGNPAELDADERRICALFDDDKSNPKRFREAIDNIRVQRGLRERTDEGLRTAQRYLPTMEKTFISYGLPTGLTRLPIVESSFNVEAYSKDAAAGIWQFIPSSARIYMHLNDVVDERRDPWASTDAAARHLRDDYDLLQNWPLAITAYNHGRAGIKRALEAVNGSTLVDLIKHYDGPRFGFASRNFYAEFLAATDVERAWRAEHHDAGTQAKPLHFDVVKTRDYVSYDTLRKLSGLDEATFRELNPAYRSEVVEGRLYVPPDQPIRVPAGSAHAFEVAYADLSGSQRFDHQRRYYSEYRVRRGDSLSVIAARHGVSTQAILAANGMRSSAVRVGQTLRIPGGDSTPTMVASADRTPSRSRSPRAHVSGRKTHHLRVHRVRSGQTLSGIAERYQVTVKSLLELNALGDKDELRAGTTLKIPAG